MLSASFDLHVLGTPPAFILSQDQTLMLKFFLSRSSLAFFWFLPEFTVLRFFCLPTEASVCQIKYLSDSLKSHLIQFCWIH